MTIAHALDRGGPTVRMAYGSYRLTLYHRQTKLEKVLAAKTAPNDDSLTLQQLATVLKLTEDQVIETASKSKKVEGSGGQSGNERRFRLIRNSN
jgi:hypothetical protein